MYLGGHDLSVGNHDGGVSHDLATSTSHDLAMSTSHDLAMSTSHDLAMSGGGGGDMATFTPTTVFTIVLENTDYASVTSTTSPPPYLSTLIQRYGLATNYMDSGHHPSLPNYLYLTSGATQYPGVVDCDPTGTCDLLYSFPVDQENLGHQLTAAGVPWRAYMDSMPSPCYLKTDASPYAPKHNPFVYFTDIQSNTSLCQQVDVDYNYNNSNTFANDLAAGTYRFMWITPDLNNDGHDTNLMTADTWLSQNVPAILNSAVFKAGGVLFITWDEGEGTLFTGDQVAMIVVTSKMVATFNMTNTPAPYQTAAAYSHASYLATIEDLFGLARLGDAQQAQNLFEFWQ
jgi:hypothetical protein